MALLRITGQVVRTDPKSGTKVDAATGEVRTWSMNLVKILVANQDVTEVSMFGDASTPVPAVGAEVDWAVNVSVRGTRQNVQLDKPWKDLFAPAPAQTPADIAAHRKAV